MVTTDFLDRMRTVLAHLDEANTKPEPYGFYKAVKIEPTGLGWKYECVGFGITDLRQLVQALESSDAQKERQHCVNRVNELAAHWEALAAKVRKDGTYTYRAVLSWPPLSREVSIVRPGWERQAAQVEDAAKGLRWLAVALQDGH